MCCIWAATAQAHRKVADGKSHTGAKFYDGLVRFMTGSPVLVMAVGGMNAIEISRKMMGATFGSKAEPGTIRGDFGVSNSFNLMHGSDSSQSATRELGLFFKPEELLEWKPAAQAWEYDFAKGSAEWWDVRLASRG